MSKTKRKKRAKKKPGSFVSAKEYDSKNGQLEGRDEKGRFVKGVSGNPAGKPAGTRNHITALRESTEHALRDYLALPANRRKALRALDRLFVICDTADDKTALQSMRILFDKILPNAKDTGEIESGKQRPVAIQIVNHTGRNDQKPVTVIDGEVVDS